MSDERLRPPAPFAARAILILVTIALYLPLLNVVVLSFRVPEGWGGEWYSQILGDGTIADALVNSPDGEFEEE